MHEGFTNASCEFDIENLKPTYKLIVGIPGKSNAFAISKKLGLDETILSRANELMQKEDVSVEELVKKIYDDKISMEKEKEEIEKNSNQIELLRKNLQRDNSVLKEQEKSIIDNAKIEARKLLLNAKEEASQIIRDLKNTVDYSSVSIAQEKLNASIKSIKTSEAISPLKGVSKEQLEIGMPILVTTINQVGTILSLPNKSNQVQVQVGSAKLNVSLAQLAITNKKVTLSNSSSNYVSRENNLKSRTISTEINVIGYNVDQAVPVIDKYLDDCSLAGLASVRIVHGKGTGALRTGIQQFLKTNKHVKSYRIGVFGEGEMGVTVVELK